MATAKASTGTTMMITADSRLWGATFIAVGLGGLSGILQIGASSPLVSIALLAAVGVLAWQGGFSNRPSLVTIIVLTGIMSGGSYFGISELWVAVACIAGGLYLVIQARPAFSKVPQPWLAVLLFLVMLTMMFLFPYVYCGMFPQRCSP